MKLKHIITISCILGMTAGMTAAAPDGYYDKLEGCKGTGLRKAAKGVVRNHTAISYGNSTWEAFMTTDTRVVDGRLCWWDMYSNNNVAASDPSSHSGMNIEHSIPNSWWGGSKNDAYKDLFELNPSDSKANSAKSNYPYGEIEGSCNFDNGVTRVGHPKSGMTGSSQGNWVYEPIDEYKGDFARSLFYMFTVYDDIAWSSSTAWMYTPGSDELLKPWAVEMLLRWAKLDPVSEKEIRRNEAVYKVQGNRNPYIDLPGLEDYVWGAWKNAAFSLANIDNPTIPDDPVIPDDPTNPDDPVIPDDPTLPEGVWYAVTSSADLNETDTYVIVSAQSSVFMSDESGGKYLKAGAMADIRNNGTRDYLADVPEGTALLRFESLGGNSYYISVYDTHYNHLQGYLTSTAAKTVTISDSPSQNSAATVTVSSSGEATIGYGSFGNLLYNASAPRFTTYTSSQEHLRLFRLHEDSTTIVDRMEENSGDVKVFTLQGLCVGEGEESSVMADLPAGIYIIVRTNESVKIRK